MDAVAGIIGTILGTILGWILNGLSARGKLKIYVSSWEDKFQYNQTGHIVPSKNRAQTEYYCYNLILDIYNSSNETKILRNIKIEFSDGKNTLHVSVPHNDATGRCDGYTVFCDTIVPLNVPPKTIIQLKLHDGASHTGDGLNGLNFIWNTQIIYLTYSNESGKEIRTIIKKDNYSNYFNAQ